MGYFIFVIHSKKCRLIFASGIGCIALGYSLWMFIGMYNPDDVSLTLPPTLAAPGGAFVFAALCWYVVIEKLCRHGTVAGAIIGVMSSWSIFASGLSAALIPSVITGNGFSNIEDFVYFVGIVFGSGPLFLFFAWGWVPVLLCMLWGAFWVPYSNTGLTKKSEG